MNRVLDLYDHPPTQGRVVCVDEFGPLNLVPRPGRGSQQAGRPSVCVPPRTVTTWSGMFNALDLRTGQL